MAAVQGQLWTWCATLAWRGDAYVGWQVQPNGPTIQEAVQNAVGRLCGLERAIQVTATGRTDAGVHAEMQIVGFQIPVERTPHQVMAGINFHTPDDIVCLGARPVPESFNPRTWTRSKLYRYRILNRTVACPFRAGLVWHLKPELDVTALAEGLALFQGQHDFSSFRAAGCAAASPVRTIQHVRTQNTRDGELHVEFEGHGFLRHQVRIMVGTLVEVGLAKRTAADIAEVLSLRRRSAAGPTAPAHGLTLVRVDLSDGPES